MFGFKEIAALCFIGCGATLVMDIWLLLLNRLGVTTLNFALIGRWVGHMRQGKFFHTAMGKATPIAHEVAIGWLIHYASGLSFSALLLMVAGADWLAQPTPLIALMTGLSTLIFPWGLMQPAMGLGFAASKTSAPLQNRVRNLANHLIFGLGLFLSARLFAALFL